MLSSSVMFTACYMSVFCQRGPRYNVTVISCINADNVWQAKPAKILICLTDFTDSFISNCLPDSCPPPPFISAATLQSLSVKLHRCCLCSHVFIKGMNFIIYGVLTFHHLSPGWHNGHMSWSHCISRHVMCTLILHLCKCSLLGWYRLCFKKWLWDVGTRKSHAAKRIALAK